MFGRRTHSVTFLLSLFALLSASAAAASHSHSKASNPLTDHLDQCDPREQLEPELEEMSSSPAGQRMPAYFISHGGGPCFYMPAEGMFKELGRGTPPAKWLLNFANQNKDMPKPKTILVVSAHWEESDGFAVNTCANPPMLYDYYGFPKYTYELDYNAPGNPELAKKVAALLAKNNIKCSFNDKRGYDHGVFVPLKSMYPDADIPIVQLSINRKLDPKQHIKLGEALAPLRDEGVMIMGSGSLTHDMAAARKPSVGPEYKNFCNWTTETLTTKSPEERLALLENWTSAPGARNAHPREDHLIPLHVVAGAAKDDKKVTQINDLFVMGFFSLACYRFE